MDGPDSDSRGKITYFGQVVPLDKIRDGDVLLIVEYERTPIHQMGNPRALGIDTAHAFAIAENAERAKLISQPKETTAQDGQPRDLRAI